LTENLAVIALDPHGERNVALLPQREVRLVLLERADLSLLFDYFKLILLVFFLLFLLKAVSPLCPHLGQHFQLSLLRDLEDHIPHYQLPLEFLEESGLKTGLSKEVRSFMDLFHIPSPYLEELESHEGVLYQLFLVPEVHSQKV